MSKDLHLQLFRLIVKQHLTQGELLVNGIRLGHTSEPAGWRQGEPSEPPTIIVKPGQYRVVVSHSEHFGRYLPEIVGVAGAEDVRIHGCELMPPRSGHILLGKDLTPDGVRETDVVNKMLISLIGETIATTGKCWIDIK